MKKCNFLSVLVLALLLGFYGIVQADLSDGLVAYYPLNGNANDESGNGNNGVVYGATSTIYQKNNSNNSAYSFDGADDYIEVYNSDDFQFGDSALTISAWFKAPKGDTYRAIIGKQEDGGGKGGIILRISADGRLAFFACYCGTVTCGTMAEHSAISPNRVDDDILHHAVGVRLSNGDLNLYLDGEYVASNLITYSNLNVNNTSSLTIGKKNNFGYKAD